MVLDLGVSYLVWTWNLHQCCQENQPRHPTLNLRKWQLTHPKFTNLVSMEIGVKTIQLWCWALLLTQLGYWRKSPIKLEKQFCYLVKFSLSIFLFQRFTLDTHILTCVYPLLMILDILDKEHVYEQLPKRVGSKGWEMSEISIFKVEWSLRRNKHPTLMNQIQNSIFWS